MGTALLSELPAARVAELYWDPHELVAFTERSTATLGQLQAKLERTREQGYAVDEGEVHPNVVGLAVVVPAGGSGEPSFGLGVSLVNPTGATDEREAIVAALRAAVTQLTRPRLLSA